MKPRLTILMPVYNGEKYLKETIDSVLAQTYRDFCFLIVNDGSTDTSRDIVLSYHDDRIVLKDNEHNLGLVATLNNAIETIDTEYIARLDCDDLWHPQKLEKQIALLDERQDVGICGTCIHKFGDIDGVFMFPEESDALKVGLLFYCMMSHPSVVYRNSFLKNTHQLYRADYFPAEDYKMWVDALQNTHIYNIQEVLVEYRQHGGQICREKQQIQADKVRMVRTDLLKLFYPNCTDEELEFHLNVFSEMNFNSDKDITHSQHWCKKLCEQNMKIQYVNSQILRSELTKYLHMAIKGYYAHKYFNEGGLGAVMKYILSGDWRNLDLHRNLSLIKNGLKTKDI